MQKVLHQEWKGSYTTEPTDIKKMVKRQNEQLVTKKFENLDKKHKYLEKSQLTQTEQS